MWVLVEVWGIGLIYVWQALEYFYGSGDQPLVQSPCDDGYGC